MEVIKYVLGSGFVLYLVLVYLLFGWIGSISNSYYQFKEKYGKGYVFTIFMFFVAICLFFIVDKLRTVEAMTFALAGAGAIFTGVAAEYYHKVTSKAHFGGAASLIAMTALGIGLQWSNWIPLYLIAATLIVFLALELWIRNGKGFIKNDVYWFEVACFVYLILGLG